MIYPEGLVNLFKKHGYWQTNLVVFIVMCASIVMAVVYANAVAMVNAIWCGVSIFSNYMLCMEKEEHEYTKGRWADTQDDLIVKEHEVERLTLELETAQAALVEAKKPRRNHSGYVQTGFSQIESGLAPKTASIDTAEANALKPKRKPAPRGTRKPKTKNENKD